MTRDRAATGVQAESLMGVLLLRSVPWAGAAGLLTLVMFLLVDGPQAALAALIGLGLVLFFFGVDVLLLRMTADMAPAATVIALLTEYFLKVLLIAALLWSLAEWTTVDLHATAVTVVASTVAWVVALSVASLRTRSFYFDSPAEGPSESALDDDISAT